MRLIMFSEIIGKKVDFRGITISENENTPFE